MTDYYVDTTVAGPGLGTQASPWKNLAYAWTRFATGTHTVYCTGGDDVLTATLSAGTLSATAITVIGNWAGYKLTDTNCYKLKIANYSLLNIGSKSVTLKRVLLENGTATSPGASERSIVVSGGTLIMEGCGYAFSAAATASYFHAVGAFNAAANITMNNCIVWVKFIGTTPVSGNTRIVTINTDVNSKIGNCIFHTGSYSYPFAASGSVNNSATPNMKSCVINGPVVAGTFTNCVITGSQNAITTGSEIANASIQNTFWVDPVNGDFTPATTPPALILNKGVDNSSVMGHSLDLHGNDRSSALAGAAWDRGPYEYGFGAPYPNVLTAGDVSQASDPECIYNSQTPAIVAGDRFSYEGTTVTNLWAVNIDAQGFPSINSNGVAGADSFKFNISRNNGPWTPTPPASDIWEFAIAPTLSNPTDTSPTIDGATVTVQTNSSLGKLYLAARTAAQGGAYAANEQLAIRDGVVGVNCSYKAQITAPLVAPAVNTFIVTGLNPGVTYYYGMAQDIEAV